MSRSLPKIGHLARVDGRKETVDHMNEDTDEHRGKRLAVWVFVLVLMLVGVALGRFAADWDHTHRSHPVPAPNVPNVESHQIIVGGDFPKVAIVCSDGKLFAISEKGGVAWIPTSLSVCPSTK